MEERKRKKHQYTLFKEQKFLGKGKNSDQRFVILEDKPCQTYCRENFFQEGPCVVCPMELKIAKSETVQIILRMRNQSHGGQVINFGLQVLAVPSSKLRAEILSLHHSILLLSATGYPSFRKTARQAVLV